MNLDLWTRVDTCFRDALMDDDAALSQALRDSDAAGLPPHHVAPNQGRLLQLLLRIQGARRVLEIGTLAGYSTIWMAHALPADGRLVSLEVNPRAAGVATIKVARAGLSDRVEIRIGTALDSLAALAAEGSEPFDFVFIDADKPNNPAYLDAVMKLVRRGSVIVGDNVVRDGAVSDAASTDPNVLGVRRFIEAMGRHPRLDATALQTVGCKGYDGFSLALVTS